MSIIKGDFLGFTYNGIHSSELGIFRVSDGSRYTENLLPTIQDKTVQVPGADGTYYFGSYYTQKPISFPISFDNLSEEGIRKIKTLFSDKTPHDLIFDELPFKVYKVKPTGTPNLKYVCFDRPEVVDYRDAEINSIINSKEELYGIGTRSSSGRIYKGEGQLNFIAYNPFARSRFKYLDKYILPNIPEWGSMDDTSASKVYYNYYDWADMSRMVLSTTKKKLDDKAYQIDVVNNNGIMIYNAGDKEVPFYLNFIFNMGTDVPKLKIGNDTIGYLELDSIPSTGLKDSGIRINSKLNLIEGIDENGKPTGKIYNKYITGGDFFKIAPTKELTWLPIYWESEPSLKKANIEYNYIYY